MLFRNVRPCTILGYTLHTFPKVNKRKKPRQHHHRIASHNTEGPRIIARNNLPHQLMQNKAPCNGTKPATSKQHYERFNLYINFQTKSGHLTDPVGEAIDLFEHTLDKTVLVWLQTNRSKFKDLTTLKMMFLQRYNHGEK